jgi:hypothetical protein
VSSPTNRRRALELLAASGNGCTMAIMLAHGFNPEMMVEMVRDGLATASAERVVEAHVRCRRVRVTEGERHAMAR